MTTSVEALARRDANYHAAMRHEAAAAAHEYARRHGEATAADGFTDGTEEQEDATATRAAWRVSKRAAAVTRTIPRDDAFTTAAGDANDEAEAAARDAVDRLDDDGETRGAHETARDAHERARDAHRRAADQADAEANEALIAERASTIASD